MNHGPASKYYDLFTSKEDIAVGFRLGAVYGNFNKSAYSETGGRAIFVVARP